MSEIDTPVTQEEIDVYNIELKLRKEESFRRRKIAQKKAANAARMRNLSNGYKYVSLLIPIKDHELAKKFAERLRTEWQKELEVQKKAYEELLEEEERMRQEHLHG